MFCALFLCNKNEKSGIFFAKITGLSQSTPLGWTQFHSWQSSMESFRRLAVGFCPMNCLTKDTSASVSTRERYLNSTAMPATIAEGKPERKVCFLFFFHVCKLSWRHGGTPCAALGSPPDSSTASWCASSLLVNAVELWGQRGKCPLESRFWHNQNPCPS